MIIRIVLKVTYMLLAMFLVSCGGDMRSEVIVELLDCNIGKVSINNIIYAVVGDSCAEQSLRIRVAYGSNEVLKTISIGSAALLKLGDRSFKIEAFLENSWREIENRNS